MQHNRSRSAKTGVKALGDQLPAFASGGASVCKKGYTELHDLDQNLTYARRTNTMLQILGWPGIDPGGSETVNTHYSYYGAGIDCYSSSRTTTCCGPNSPQL